jgi:hypothetical protein
VEEISIQSTRGFDLSASGNFYVRFLGGIENQFVSLPIAFVLGPVAVGHFLRRFRITPAHRIATGLYPLMSEFADFA